MTRTSMFEHNGLRVYYGDRNLDKLRWNAPGPRVVVLGNFVCREPNKEMVWPEKLIVGGDCTISNTKVLPTHIICTGRLTLENCGSFPGYIHCKDLLVLGQTTWQNPLQTLIVDNMAFFSADTLSELPENEEVTTAGLPILGISGTGGLI